MSKVSDGVQDALAGVEITSSRNNGPVQIAGNTEGLQCIGIGTDAAVFRHINTPSFAYKVYAKDKVYKKDIEHYVYKVLGKTETLPMLYETGDRYLKLGYEAGPTLYDCLVQGIHIPAQVILDVEDTRSYIRECGLNPRDIHLKNILLQEGRAKVLDVSEYVMTGNDFRWEHLKKAYECYYHFIDGKPVPYWLMETIRKWYNHSPKDFDTIDEFMKKIANLTMFKR
ncbi:serine/threonine protein kinase [Thalassobacillus sp. B23F22_16]|uniref:serine/threonine protein kinase n=1 Tax=Thalassobacillus sp. B23F22_16 TaxID=3459513 RepID=UPI00373E958D